MPRASGARTPFDGVLFRVEDGKLVAEGYE